MDKRTNIKDVAALVIAGIMGLFLMYIMIWIFSLNILYERMGISNGFVRVFIGEEIDKENNSFYGKDTAVDWQAEYPFLNPDELPDYARIKEQVSEPLDVTTQIVSNSKILTMYTNIINHLKVMFSDYSVKAIPFITSSATVSKKIKSALGIKYDGTESDVKVFTLQNGYLAYEQAEVSKEDLSEIADSVSNLNNFLSERDIPFLYINAGSKVCPYDKQLGEGDIEKTNENADTLIDELDARGVSVLDYREAMIDAGMDWYKAYYKTDHHWTNVTQLWAAGALADKLNTDYGYNFDPAYFDKQQYEIIDYENYWYGGEGRVDAFASSGLEDFETVFPKFVTDYTVLIPSKAIDITGDYEQVMFDKETFEKIADYSKDDFLSKPDAYYCSRIDNYALMHIINNMDSNNDKKVLFIQDSFAWYLTGYLAADIRQIDIIYTMEFNGSIRTYIEKTKPDMVIMLFCERDIYPIDWSDHLGTFDLR